MRPTRRGAATLAVVGLAVTMAWLSGPRSLNAVAAPLSIALAVGALQVTRAGAPTVERSQPRRGFPGESRTVSLTVEGRGVATITEGLADGLSAAAEFERTLPATVSYDLRYDARGVYELSRTTVAVRDVLGLVEQRHEVTERTEVVVYPAVYSLGGATFERTLGLDSGQRSEFDRLREYVPGDSLRDVHWKSSAKHDDLLVTEFSDPVGGEGISIAARSTEGHADEMAAGAATVLVGALRAGLTTAMTVPAGSIEAGGGQRHRQRALELLARTSSGDVDETAWNRADVRVRADATGVTVSLGDAVHELTELTTTRDNPLVAEGVS
ncbi:MULTISPECIES: DUF58 domain-containing protein [Halomicrobium]|uniref:Uncharacterized protein n=2 Tax=Halomicrobium mukohataei TaxID=57705 RepID=C7NZ75_HALMD|nr:MULTISPECIES: DUF58 domain-containing protein [Halomicrobium]ACV46761.1 protein of unknown function DUF58 [Halomicrobium mukohataei DSM 12286]QCD65270.1 DUF58 domain-containing protein [Halomicrobium mukohataei]QFR20076.1 DUF58 domain-containing protein [Halomicrobium sp. ZPS1]